MTNNGGVDGALRYNGSQARIADFVNSTGTPSPMAVDIDANPILSFDIIWDGSGSFGTVLVDTNTNASGAPTGNIFTQSLTADVATTISFNLRDATDYQGFLTAVAADAPNPTFQQFPRILVQSADGEAGTFAIDNVQLAAIPEPSSYAWLAGSMALLFIVNCRRR
ncbi:MAG: hypothetical protein GVY36_05975 [Verrucomicrobia bacterium]|nr:hypothetical protein [Verrucomicrobiota bacterium]